LDEEEEEEEEDLNLGYSYCLDLNVAETMEPWTRVERVYHDNAQSQTLSWHRGGVSKGLHIEQMKSYMGCVSGSMIRQVQANLQAGMQGSCSGLLGRYSQSLILFSYTYR